MGGNCNRFAAELLAEKTWKALDALQQLTIDNQAHQDVSPAEMEKRLENLCFEKKT